MKTRFTNSAIVLCITILVMAITSCQQDHTSGGSGTDSTSGNTMSPGGSSECIALTGTQELKLGNVSIEVMVPEGEIIGDMLVLPGWNFSRTDWCMKSSLCKRALKKGYRLIMPEMGKSIYASRYYPETRPDWRAYPTRTWLTDTMITYLQENYCLLKKGSDNYLMGLSTGARGVALVGLYRPDLFLAGAALSGDYDQRQLQGDNLMRGIYGDFKDFPERWEGEDNPTVHVADLKLPLYLGHGKDDDVVPPQQTEAFYQAITKAHPEIQAVLKMAPNKGHDYGYWNSEVDEMLSFFGKFHGATAAASH